MHHKKVSIIIPVYQVENYLERAVDSALAQTLEEKEIILVDDAAWMLLPKFATIMHRLIRSSFKSFIKKMKPGHGAQYRNTACNGRIHCVFRFR